MEKLSKSLTKRAPRRCGSIKNIGIKEMEKIEYRQTGMIRIKDTAVSKGELDRLSYNDVDYYDYTEGGMSRWFDELGIL